MSRLPVCAIVAALAVALAPSASADDRGNLTIYHADNDALFTGNTPGTLDAGHALVHETRSLTLAAGTHEVRIGGLPAQVDPEAITVDFGNAAGVDVLGQRVRLATGSTGSALDAAIGRQVQVHTGDPSTDSAGTLTGMLVGASGGTLLVRTPDGAVQLVRQYASVTLPPGSATGGSSLLMDIDAKAAAHPEASLTYLTSGLGWRAAYTASLLSGGDCRMQFKPMASIANRSGRDYDQATIKLIAGQVNLGRPGLRMYSMAKAAPRPASAAVMPEQASLGDYRSFTLPGATDLPDGSVTLVPLYRTRALACHRQYLVEDGNPGFPPRPNTNDYGSQDYQGRPISSILSFAAPEALPAGVLRAWTRDHDGAAALLGQGTIADTPKGQDVSVQLGQSFDLRADRERTQFKVDARARTMTEAYRVTLSNGGDAARTVTIREHPNRWREWTLASSSTRPSKQTPQLLEFEIPVTAHGEATLTYSVTYTWTAADM